MQENKWDGSLIGLVNLFLPQINISDSSKEKLIEKLEKANEKSIDKGIKD